MLSRLFRLLGFGVLALQAQTPPSYREVIDHVWANYQFAPEHYLKSFARTPEGWDIAYEHRITSEGTAEPERWYPLWRNGSYRNLKLERTEPSESVQQPPADMYRNLYGYERCIYFGYPQWAKDVMRDYGGKNNLSLPELESLSRAYSHYARGYINGAQWGDNADATEKGRQGADSLGRITSFQAEQYAAYVRKALETMDRMIAMDPNYPVLVGHIRNKHANECMDAWYLLSVHGYAGLAKEFLGRAQYDPIMRYWAQTCLAAVPDQGILITNGDNDTYPLWYEQAVSSPDSRLRGLSVMNHSLLNMPVYAAAAMMRPPVGQKIRMQHAAAALDATGGALRLPGWLETRPGEAIDAAELLKKLYAGHDKVYTDHIIAIKGKDSLTYQPGRFLASAEWHVFDIWLSSGNRPVCAGFAMASELKKMRGTVDFGLFERLGDEQAGKRADTNAIRAWLLNGYKPVPADPLWDERIHTTADMYAAEAARSIAMLLGAVKQGSPEAEMLGQKALELYPESGFYGNDGAIELMEALYRAGMYGTAGHLLSLWVSDAEARWDLLERGRMGGVLASDWVTAEEVRELEGRWTGSGMPEQALGDLRNALSQSRVFR